MVFSSLPAYLDPANWQQQPNQHIFHQAGGTNQQLITPPSQTTPPPPPSAQPHGGGGVGSPGSIRPSSMSERARLANIPMPEGPLKCPRCDSTNTKFCYFNNYSLTQPRHFCKTCRRYWTRGGALRSVPVGGGCRRNKRAKSTSSNSNKSPVSQAASSSTTSTMSSHNTGLIIQATHSNANNIMSTGLNSMRFMSPLGQFTDNYNSPGDIGLNFSGISTPLVGGTSEMNFQIGNNLLPLGGGIEQWRLPQQASQQFPFLSGSVGGVDDQSAPGIYPFQLGGNGGGINPETGFISESIHHNQVRPNEKLSASFLSQLASVKMEDPNNNPAARAGSGSLSLSRQFLGMNNVSTSDHQWNNNGNNNTINNNNNNNVNTAAWTGLSSFSRSSSTSNPI